MELFVILGAAVLLIFVFKKLMKPNNSDKLTLLQLENWVSVYSKASLFERSSMATSLMYQSAIAANSMGANISPKELMREHSTSNETSIEAVDYWLDYIKSEMTKDVPLAELNACVARVVGALVILKKINPTMYREFIGSNR